MNKSVALRIETLSATDLADVHGGDRGYVRKPDGSYVNVPVNPSGFGAWIRKQEGK